MIFFNLTGNNNASERREALGRELGIGYCNSASFLHRLNCFSITREEFLKAVKKIEK